MEGISSVQLPGKEQEEDDSPYNHVRGTVAGCNINFRGSQKFSFPGKADPENHSSELELLVGVSEGHELGPDGRVLEEDALVQTWPNTTLQDLWASRQIFRIFPRFSGFFIIN
jgi:hypothetical protein